MSLLSDMLYVVIPPRCHLCGDLLVEGEQYLCTTCLATLPRTLYHRMDLNPMEQRFAGFFPFERATGHFFYTPGTGIASLIHDFKYRRFPRLARWLGSVMGRELLPSGFFSDVSLLMPVPIHWTKRMRRGYNQTEYLARGISDATGIPVGDNLRAVRPHRTQTMLSHEERRKNLNGVFAVSHPERLHGTHLLLVDDVCTTGATLRTAAQLLHDTVPGVRLSILSLCVTSQ